MNKFILVVIMVLSLVLLVVVSGYHRSHQYVPSKDVAIIDGECVMFNWDTSYDDVEKAVEVWFNMRQEQR